METFDVVVVGGGPGGYPAAIRAAQLGARVALIEKESLGGTCLNWGCIPTKTLIAAADVFRHLRHAAAFGLKADAVAFDYAAMARRKDEVVARLRGGVAALLKAHGVRVYQGRGAFADRDRLAVTAADGGTEPIAAKQTIIATGSDSVVPRFIPRHERVVASRAFLDRTSLPASLIVLGGGVIGCEFACMAAQLGVEVTVVEMLEDILIVVDADVRRELRRHMETELGIRLLTGKPMEAIEAGASGVSGQVGDDRVEAEVLLVSIGRRPITEGLALERAGLATNEKGFIEVDGVCRTKAAGIYAVGDVTAGTTQLAHAATAQGIAAAENACGANRLPAENLVPACIFTAPEIGSVGLTEAQAQARGVAVKTGKYALGGLGRAMAAGATQGFVKWVVDAKTDQLLGAQAVGAHATELIAEAATAIRAELTAVELGRTVHCHPTFGEAWMEAAHAVHGTCVHQAPRRK